jgi:YD repeat-containing protein
MMTSSWTFDQCGLTTSTTTPPGNAAGFVRADFTTTYTNDELGRGEDGRAEGIGRTRRRCSGRGAADGVRRVRRSRSGDLGEDRLGRTTVLTAPSYTPSGGRVVTPPTTTFKYDVVGNVLAQIDERGNATRFGYDHLNQQVQVAARSTTNNDERAVSKTLTHRTGTWHRPRIRWVR